LKMSELQILKVVIRQTAAWLPGGLLNNLIAIS